MKGFTKSLIITGLILLAIFLFIYYGVPAIINHYTAPYKQIVTNLQADLTKAHKINQDLTGLYANTNYLSTTQVGSLNKVIKNITKYNSSLKNTIDSLNGKLTGVHVGTGPIVLNGQTSVPLDSAWAYNDPDSFVSINFTPPMQIGGRFPMLEQASLDWKLRATLKVIGVEKTDGYHNRLELEKAYLISPKGVIKEIELHTEYVTLKDKIQLYHWNPRIHSDILFGGRLGYGVSFNLMSYGINKYAETTYLYFPTFGIASDFKNNIYLTFSPIKCNIGTIIPVITNLEISPTVIWGSNQPLRVRVSLGLVH